MSEDIPEAMAGESSTGSGARDGGYVCAERAAGAPFHAAATRARAGFSAGSVAVVAV